MPTAANASPTQPISPHNPEPQLQERQYETTIPTVRDRVVQAASKIVLEPIFEADMLDCSFGFRPRRSAHDALQVLIDECWQGRRWVVETDIASCFEAIPHDRLMTAVQERVSDQGVLKLVRSMLRAGVMDEGSVRRPVTGTPQGGVVSPLLANIYLHRVDRSRDVARHGVLARYADDLVVMCRSRGQAEAALEQLRALLAGLGLEPKPAKTRIVRLQVGGEGFDFLGFHHRLVRSQGRTGKAGVTFLARWPAKQAMQHARQRVRELTDRSRLLLPVDWVTGQVNRFLRGWAAYFRYGNSADQFDKINGYARMRMAWFITSNGARTAPAPPDSAGSTPSETHSVSGESAETGSFEPAEAMAHFGRGHINIPKATNPEYHPVGQVRTTDTPNC